MTTIEFSGGGDDIIQVVIGSQVDEIYTYEKGPVMWRGDLIAPEDDGVALTMRVYALLIDGVWSFLATIADEAIGFPDWDVAIERDPYCEYSTLLRIDAPPGTRLVGSRLAKTEEKA